MRKLRMSVICLIAKTNFSQVLTDSALARLEAKLIDVLEHAKCGAVAATLA